MQAVHKLLVLYYVIGNSPRSARSKLRFLSFCDQNPWKDVKSLIVFFFNLYPWVNFLSKIEKNKGDRDFKLLHHQKYLSHDKFNCIKYNCQLSQSFSHRINNIAKVCYDEAILKKSINCAEAFS